MPKLWIPAAAACGTLARDLRNGHAGWLVRLGLSLVAATAILSLAMIWMGLLEASGGWLRDEHIAMTVGVAAAAWCGVLALIWWTFRRFQIALKAIFAFIATWAIVVPTTLVIDSAAGSGQEFLVAAALLFGVATSLGFVILICYRRASAARPGHAIVHVRMACPACGYSLIGLTDCRCPECGSTYTVEALIEALGRGQLVSLDADEGAPSAEEAVPFGPVIEPPLELPAGRAGELEGAG